LDGGYAVVLDQLEQLRSALLQEDVAHERTERVHIVTQRLMLRRKMYL
jgi:hypothetical protein